MHSENSVNPENSDSDKKNITGLRSKLGLVVEFQATGIPFYLFGYSYEE
jgi:hypothetical protein